ncbi:MAG: tRNA (adenosine(37)-N6)-threonylcarbamoyltransferase complex dimerization subunit type 1 TsaB [Flavobacteriaceae bacterium]|nr:tRNA (adenosine(37)-N6)-threonylcarbamoyltransferase complex dimerization subunit type 1 TsaB [Bacteroidia bacterium]NNL17002.1 tRNA (adenosine(37)-N6)-threonylcarbamoyltransferase complex dimerization subunit type 1 TsaB [Flavobacteriaceae bacterium]
MALILNIETATTNCSVSLAKDGKTISLAEDNDKSYSHSERLHIYIQEVLDKSKIQLKDLDAVAVSKGPGSYTGLRIGVSAAKGLCYSLDIPLISILTLESLVNQVKAEKGYIVPMLDARRMEVYSSVYNFRHELVRDIEAQILDEQSFQKILNDTKVRFIGSGVVKTKSLIGHKNAIFIDGKLPSANEMSLLSYEKYKKSDTEDVAYFEPFYLKDFVALKSKN